MITGYNTDVEHEGVVYHVQTEDKGLESPLILSLVYSGGAILASKRSRYEDLIASGFSDEALAERLKRQHRLICAAILAGRLEELKRMGGQTGPLMLDAERAKLVTGATGPLPPSPQKTEPVAVPPSPPSPSQPDTLASQDQRHLSPMGELPAVAEGLQVILLEDQEFRSGDSLVLRIMVRQQSGNEDKPINGASVSVKVLGTTFRPQIYSVKTQKDGIAVVPAEIPKFSSGRAAILIRVLANGRETEMRRVIHAT